MKYLFLFIPFLSFQSASGQNITVDDIPLNWSDFNVTENRGDKYYTAYISTPILYRIIPNIVLGQTKYLISSRCYIDYASNWVNKKFIENAGNSTKEQLLRHEKGHLAIGFIYRKKFQDEVSKHAFTGSIHSEVDSIFKQVYADMKKMDNDYDQATSHGTNPQQQTWEENLGKELSRLYKDKNEFFASDTVKLHCDQMLVKLNDPLNFSYEHTQTAMEVLFSNDSITNQIGYQYQLSKDAPLKGAVDSIITIKEIAFDKDFEITCSFRFEKPGNKKEFRLAMSLGISDSTGGNTWIALASSQLRLIYCFGGDHKRDKEKTIHLYPKLAEDYNTLSIRRIKDKYHIFINGRFVKEFPYEQLKEKQLEIVPVNNSPELNRFSIHYLE